MRVGYEAGAVDAFLLPKHGSLLPAPFSPLNLPIRKQYLGLL